MSQTTEQKKTEEKPRELPKTASPMGLLGLIGLISLSGSYLTGFFRR
jgi:LPXTG-motif cell wall-anchored protein